MAKESETLLKELARRANDIIRVHNPTQEEFVTVFSGYNFPVPFVTNDIGFGNGNADIPRHVAQNYITHMADKMLTKRADNHIADLNKKRLGRGQAQLTPQEREIEEGPYRTDNEKNRAEVIKTLWIGLVTKYGGDTPPPQPQDKVDHRPLDQKILDDMADKPVSNEATPPTPDSDIIKEQLKKDLS